MCILATCITASVPVSHPPPASPLPRSGPRCAHENREQDVTNQLVHTPLPHVPAQDAHLEAPGTTEQTRLSTNWSSGRVTKSLVREAGVTAKHGTAATTEVNGDEDRHDEQVPDQGELQGGADLGV